MKNLIIINAHPDKQSYNYALAEAFVSGLNKQHWQITTINLSDLHFNPILQFGYRQRTELEPDLLDAIEKIKAANHLVWFFPVWWYGAPALMKGFIDRTFLPGISFKYVDGKSFPEKLFSGKTAHIIVTADTPCWYDFLVMKSPAINQFKKGTLQFCGISPVKVTYIAPIRNSTEKFRQNWLQKVKRLAEKTR